MSKEAFRLAAVINETNIRCDNALTAIANNIVSNYDAGTLTQYDAYSMMATLAAMADGRNVDAERMQQVLALNAA